jgi:hypothetical protein
MTMDGLLRQWPLAELLSDGAPALPSRETTQPIAEPFFLAVNPLRITLLLVLAGHEAIVRATGGKGGGKGTLPGRPVGVSRGPLTRGWRLDL